MGQAGMQIRVGREVSDAQLIEILKDQKVLPNYLKQVMKINPVMADEVAPTLASIIVSKARECNESHLVSDVAKAMLSQSPSQEEMDAFRQAVDEVAVVRGEVKARSHLIKTNVGKLWYIIKKGVGTEDLEDQGVNATIGVRG